MNVWFPSDRDECKDTSDTCGVGEECVNTIGSYSCNCASGYTGVAGNCQGNLLAFIFTGTYYNETLPKYLKPDITLVVCHLLLFFNFHWGPREAIFNVAGDWIFLALTYLSICYNYSWKPWKFFWYHFFSFVNSETILRECRWQIHH